jgi:ABC-type antimicrobial peptide transport system permease subunit
MPLEQSPQPGLGIVVRSGLPLDSLIPPLRSLLARLAPTVALNSPGSLRAKLDENVAGGLFFLEMLLAMGGVAVLLCAVGLYSLVAFTGAQRRREIGIRLALGASAAQLQRMLLAGGLRLTLAALAAGCAVGWLGLRVLQYAGAGPLSPGVWIRIGIPALLLGLAAIAAVYIPARRASRADPLSVLRAE